MRTTFKAGVCSFLGIATLIIIVLVGYIVSCFLDNQILNEDMSFSLNYNNISAGYSSYWVANSRVYFSDNVGYLYPYYEITKEGKEKIAFVGGPSSHGIQTYGDKVYIYDISGDKVRIREYLASTRTKTSTIIANKLSEGTGKILQCFVIERYAYVLTHEDSVKTLIKISLDTKSFEEICSDIISVGVMNGSVVYLTEKENVYNVFKYDPETLSSTLIGEFYSDIYTLGLFVDGNYTSNSIILFDTDYEKNTSKILLYNLEDNTLKDFTVDFIVSSMIAYENNAFCVVTTEFHDEDSGKDKNVLYKMDIDRGTFEKLDDIEGMVDLFVTSDDDVFVSSSSFNGLRHYRGNGEYTQAIKAK